MIGGGGVWVIVYTKVGTPRQGGKYRDISQKSLRPMGVLNILEDVGIFSSRATNHPLTLNLASKDITTSP